MFELIKTETKIDFIGKSKIYFTVSIILCIIEIGRASCRERVYVRV